eukprot:3088403-Alexandrium_andersonii.AAC.1
MATPSITKLPTLVIPAGTPSAIIVKSVLHELNAQLFDDFVSQPTDGVQIEIVRTTGKTAPTTK